MSNIIYNIASAVNTEKNYLCCYTKSRFYAITDETKTQHLIVWKSVRAALMFTVVCVSSIAGPYFFTLTFSIAIAKPAIDYANFRSSFIKSKSVKPKFPDLQSTSNQNKHTQIIDKPEPYLTFHEPNISERAQAHSNALLKFCNSIIPTSLIKINKPDDPMYFDIRTIFNSKIIIDRHDTRPIALFIRAKEDPNGILDRPFRSLISFDAAVDKDLFFQRYQVWALDKVKNIVQIIKKIESIQGKKIGLIWFMCHGNREEMALSSSGHLSCSINSANISELTNVIKNKILEKDVTIILDSCRTREQDPTSNTISIAEQFKSGVPQARVFAHTDGVSKTIFFIRIGDIITIGKKRQGEIMCEFYKKSRADVERDDF